MQQQKRKTLKIIIISIIWLWTTAFSSMASTEIEKSTDNNTIEPAENQYFEMRATEIKEVEGQNRQVIFELWGYDIEFKRI